MKSSSGKSSTPFRGNESRSSYMKFPKRIEKMRLPAVVRRSFGQRGLVESDENREMAAEELGFQQGSHESHGRHDGYDQDARGEKMWEVEICMNYKRWKVRVVEDFFFVKEEYMRKVRRLVLKEDSIASFCGWLGLSKVGDALSLSETPGPGEDMSLPGACNMEAETAFEMPLMASWI